MKNNKLTNLISTAKNFTKDNSPAILTGMAVAGLVTTVILAYKAGSKADKIISDKRKDLELVKPNDTEAKKTIIKEAAKELTPVLLPTVLTGSVTIACIIGSNKVSSKRVSALSAAYRISSDAVGKLNEKMTEVLGEQKTNEIKETIAKEKMDKNMKQNPETPIIMTGDGDVLCMDLYSGRLFKSNAQKIGQAVNQLSADLQTDMYVSLNDFYDLLNIPRIPLGDDLGWNIDDAIRGQLPITMTAQLTEDQNPCLCIEYDARLREDYRNLH